MANARARRPVRAALSRAAGSGASTVPTTEEPVRTLAALVHGRLRADLVRGRLRPGDRLRFNVLRRSYGVGLSPLREALSRLAADGLVSLQGQRGFQVAPVSLADLRDVYEVRRGLEVTALRASIARGDDRWEAEIVAAFHRLRKSYLRGRDHPALLGDEWELAHRAFHLALLSACGSPWLLHLRNILFDHAERYRQLAVAYGYPSRVSLGEHRAMVEATLARDAGRACRLLETHLRKTADIVARGTGRFEARRPVPGRPRQGQPVATTGPRVAGARAHRGPRP
jgi:DNA-binding GntR family transcriptional regulator